MKQSEDTSTIDLIGGEPRKRGRPAKYANAAERVAAFRERKKVVQLNVSISAELSEALKAFVERQVDYGGLNQSQVIEKLLRSQLMRKR